MPNGAVAVPRRLATAPPHSVALILLFPFALYRLISRRDIRVRSFDIGFLAFAAWSVVVYAMHSGQEGVVYGGSLALESFGAYVVARAYVRDGAAMLATTRMMVLAIALAAVFALPETLFGQLYTHDFLRQLTGYQHPVGIEQRLGLTRAYGTFDHPSTRHFLRRSVRGALFSGNEALAEAQDERH